MEGKPIEPAAIDMAVLGAYGATMLTVQAFERNLAVLVLAPEAKPWKTKPFKNKEQFRASKPGWRNSPRAKRPSPSERSS